MDFNRLYAVFASSTLEAPQRRWQNFVHFSLRIIEPHATTSYTSELFADVKRIWQADEPDPGKLEARRVKAWKYLENKSGTWTVMEDREDIVIRCLIGLLRPYRSDGRVADTAGFIVDNLVDAEFND